MTKPYYRNNSAAIKFKVHRLDSSDPLDLSPNLLSLQHTASKVSPFSQWSAVFKFENAWTTLDMLQEIEDDDWVEMAITGNGVNAKLSDYVPVDLGLVDTIDLNMAISQSSAAEWVLPIAGRGWSKALTDTDVSTFKRKLKDSGFSGSIMTPEQSNKFGAELKALYNKDKSDTKIYGVLKRLLDTMLDGQWKLPKTLGLSESLSVDTVPYEIAHFPVQGTNWQGLSMFGGINGKIWQMLRTFENDPALVELWPGCVQEEVNGIPSLKPVLHYRSTPFSSEEWRYLPTTRISYRYVTNMKIGKNGAERFNVAAVVPAIADSEEQEVIYASRNLPLVDVSSIEKHGSRLWLPSDSMAPSDRGLAPDYIQSMSNRIWDEFADMPNMLSGTIDLHGTFISPTIVGTRAAFNIRTDLEEWEQTSYFAHGDLMEFYVEGITTNCMVKPENGLVMISQSLAVTRGKILPSAEGLI